MNRWRQRLAELHGDGAQPPVALPRAVQDVQNVQNVQNPAPGPRFEHFEQFEQSTEPPAPSMPAADPVPAIWGEAEAERAGIVEHDGRVPREWAEGFARLDPDRPPADVLPRRWQRFVDDVGRFLDGDLAAVAAAFGWGPLDLFGCDRARPFARIDQQGLCWLLNGDRLYALAADTAVIEMRTGARQTFRLRATESGRVLAWELPL